MSKLSELKALLLPLIFVAVLAIWWGIVSFIHPTYSIMADGTREYTLLMWVLTLAALAVPFCFYIFSPEYLSLSLDRKFLLGGLAVLTCSMVHCARCFIDAEIFFCVTTIVYFVLDKRRHYRAPLWQYWVVVAYLVWNLVSLAWSCNPHFGHKLASHFVPMLLYPAMFLAFTLTKDERDAILNLFWRVGMVAVLLSFCSGVYELTVQGLPLNGLVHFKIGMLKELYFDEQGNEIFIFNMLYGWSGMGHPSYNSVWAVAAALCGVWLISRGRICWTEFVFGELILMALQFSAQSRIGIVMMCVTWAFAYVFLLWNSHRGFLCWSVAVVVFVVVGAFLVKPDLLGTFAQDDDRAFQWGLASDYLHADGLWGSGLGGLTGDHVAEVTGYPYPWPERAHEDVYVHNQFICDWMQSGVVGFILSVLLVVSVVWMSICQKSPLAFVFCLAIIFFMMIEMPLRFLHSVTIISFFLCLFLSRISFSD